MPGASELVTAFRDTAWVAERPEIHLRPHVEAWCERDRRLAVNDAYIDDRHSYVLDVEWQGPPACVGEARATVFSLIGSVAESATYVRQRRVADGVDGSEERLQFEVCTGALAFDASFEPHGHVVVINVAGLL